MIDVPAARPRLAHLQVCSDLYAETAGGEYYAYRSDRRHMWRLISRDGRFAPVARRTVVELDAYLTVWLATRGGAR